VSSLDPKIRGGRLVKENRTANECSEAGKRQSKSQIRKGLEELPRKKG